MDTIKQLNWRYATKKFDATKKQNEAIRKPLVEASYFQKQVVEASHLLIICIQNNIETLDVNQYYNNIKGIRNTAEDVLKPHRESLIKMMEGKSIQERQQWSTNQAYIALGNLMTVCAMEGVDACPMEGFVPAKYDEILKLGEKGLKSVLLLPVGYRADDDMFSSLKKVRKPIEEAIITL